MSVSIQANSVISFANLAGGLDSTRDRVQRQQNCASQVNFFEKQKANLKNMECSTLEDIARKLEMFHSYEDQIAAVKQQYNNSQMAHVLDEAKEMLQSLLEKFPAYKPELVYACQEPPAPMDTEGIDTLATLAEKQNAAWTKIASGAGHDSQIIAPKIKTNMIFVPSKDGISHSPDEFTSLKDIAPGYELMKAYMKEVVWQRKEK